jgi:hypothetical protein
MYKKDFPLAVLRELQKYTQQKGDEIEILSSKGYLIHIIDNDPESKFHFIIEKFEIDQRGVFYFHTQRSPVDSTTNGPKKERILMKDCFRYFEAWRSLILEFENTPFFLEDPIHKAFEKEFYDEFGKYERSDDGSIFSSNDIIKIDNTLQDIYLSLEQYKTDLNKEKIEEIQEDVLVIRNNLTQKTKKWVIKNIAKAWGKISKLGVKYLKDVASESRKETIKLIVKESFDAIKDNVSNLLS